MAENKIRQRDHRLWALVAEAILRCAQEFAPGLDKELLALIQATAEVEIATHGAVTH